MGINGVPLEIPEYPESEYQAIVLMPSAKLMPICNKLSSFGDRDTGTDFTIRLTITVAHGGF